MCWPKNAGLYRILYQNNDPNTCSPYVWWLLHDVSEQMAARVACKPHCYFALQRSTHVVYVCVCVSCSLTRPRSFVHSFDSLVCGRFSVFHFVLFYVVSSFLIPSIVIRWTAAHQFVRTKFPMKLDSYPHIQPLTLPNFAFVLHISDVVLPSFSPFSKSILQFHSIHAITIRHNCYNAALHSIFGS